MSIFVAILFPQLAETSLVYALLATALIDSGHVYTTAWRTVLNAEERISMALYWILPLMIFCFFSYWHYSGIPYLWSFVVYSTLFHHIRQVYGFSKWYQHLNRRKDRKSDYWLYILSILPIIIYHFRQGAIGAYYSDYDLLLFPHQGLFTILRLVYAFLILGWLVYEIFLWRKGLHEGNRFLSVLFSVLVYGYCFLIGQTITQVLFPLLFIHGIAYFGVMGQTLHRTQTQRFATPSMALGVVLITAFIFGLTESWVEEDLVELISDYPSWVRALLVGGLLTPLFCHYVFDAMIWKSTHREAKSTFRNL